MVLFCEQMKIIGEIELRVWQFICCFKVEVVAKNWSIQPRLLTDRYYDPRLLTLNNWLILHVNFQHRLWWYAIPPYMFHFILARYHAKSYVLSGLRETDRFNTICQTKLTYNYVVKETQMPCSAYLICTFSRKEVYVMGVKPGVKLWGHLSLWRWFLKWCPCKVFWMMGRFGWI